MDGTTTVEKEWIAMKDEEVVLKRNSRPMVLEELYKRGGSPDDYKILAVPKAHGSIWL